MIIRLIIIGFLGCLISINIGFAQQGFSLGVRAGGTLSSFSSTESFKPFYSAVVRPSPHIEVVYALNEKFSLESGLGYYHTAQKRINFRNEFIGVYLPLFITYDFLSQGGGKIKPFVSTGAEFIYIGIANHNEDQVSRSIISHINRRQGSFILGGGVKYELKKQKELLIGLYAKSGITSFPEGKSEPFLPRLRPFQIGVNIGFRWAIPEKDNEKEKTP